MLSLEAYMLSCIYVMTTQIYNKHLETQFKWAKSHETVVFHFPKMLLEHYLFELHPNTRLDALVSAVDGNGGLIGLPKTILTQGRILFVYIKGRL